jgi:3-oxoacyl-[acyl-carrier-protein] synthase III
VQNACFFAASELDLIILATTTPDKIFPATATILQKAIGGKILSGVEVAKR